MNSLSREGYPCWDGFQISYSDDGADCIFYSVVSKMPSPEIIPLELLFAKPHKDQLRVSPNGTYLAWRGRVDGILNLFVQKADATVCANRICSIDPNKYKQLTFFSDRDACVHFTFTPDEKTILFIRDIKRGSESYHLYSIDIGPFFDREQDVPSPRNLIRDPQKTCAIGFAGGLQLWTSPMSPRTVYLSTAPIGAYSMFWDISRIDIDSGEIDIIEQNVMATWRGRIRLIVMSLICWIAKWLLRAVSKVAPFTLHLNAPRLPGIPIQWFPDKDMQFRGRIEVHLDLSFSFTVKERGICKQWKSLHSVAFDDANLQLFGSSGGSGTALMEFSPSNDTVDVHVCAFDDCNTKSFERFDVRTAKHITRLANNNRVDIAGFVSHPKTGKTQYVLYESAKVTTERVSDETSLGRNDYDDLGYLKAYFEPAMVFYIISRAYNSKLWIIYAVSDIGQQCCHGSPGGYFIFSNDADNRRISLAFPTRPELCSFELSPMTPVSIKARDGEDIMCYLSSPPDSENKPLVLLIHGGPQARDHWGYHPICQFLCNRGFRTLQVNYRGSTGFGERFLKLGMNGQFYQSVQTDISDAAVAFSSGQNTVIFGASFGGYSALWGITEATELYKCAIVICPLTVVGAANEEGNKMFGGSPLIAKYWQQVFGIDVSNTREVAKKASPLYQMNKLASGVSIQLFHGENDPRAPFEHSVRVIDEVNRQIKKGKNISGEFVSFADEGHGICKEENVLYMYKRIEQYLCRRFNIDIVSECNCENNTACVRWSSNEVPINISEKEDSNMYKKQQ